MIFIEHGESNVKKTILVVLLCVAFAGPAHAERTAVRGQVPDVGHSFGIGGASGMCSVVYYDVCSNWAWFWTGLPGDQIGVIFDLPADCGKGAGDFCTNMHFWWYWRFTTPSRGFVNYELYEVDASGCLIEPSLAEVTGVTPVERWNYHDGFGAFAADRVAIVATFPTAASFIRVTSDNNVENAALGCAPPALTARSFWFGIEGTTAYCPPVPVTDPNGPVNLLVKAGFECGITSVPSAGSEQNASWSSIKDLFR
ncbi:MAG: hypothetical protein ABIK65_14430 [Candidatus Eisenbacteria bacterium]